VAGTSGSHQRVRPDDLLNTPIGNPRDVHARTAALVTGLGLRAQGARCESFKLAATRDALLPALMSGRLRVRDAERAVSASV
jgi:type I restriction enzyme S subunit